MSITSVVATTTWNSVDVIGTFVSHYRKLGFEKLLVMDFHSTDGTLEVLSDPAWRGFVELVPFPGLAGLDSSNILLSRGRAQYPPDAWCLFCDPDELLVTPGMDVRRATPQSLSQGADSLVLPRFNVTAPRSVAQSSEERLTALDALTLKIEHRHQRTVERDIHAHTLVPPWIFTAIGGKVCVRFDDAIGVGEGDHSVRTTTGTVGTQPEGMYLLHYPFRRYSTFRDKIELARASFDANPHLSQAYGWQVRRWIALADADLLYREYLQQFIADEDIEALIGSGAITLERRIEDFHRTATG